MNKCVVLRSSCFRLLVFGKGLLTYSLHQQELKMSKPPILFIVLPVYEVANHRYTSATSAFGVYLVRNMPIKNAGLLEIMMQKKKCLR